MTHQRAEFSCLLCDCKNHFVSLVAARQLSGIKAMRIESVPLSLAIEDICRTKGVAAGRIGGKSYASDRMSVWTRMCSVGTIVEVQVLAPQIRVVPNLRGLAHAHRESVFFPAFAFRHHASASYKVLLICDRFHSVHIRASCLVLSFTSADSRTSDDRSSVLTCAPKGNTHT